MQLSTQPVAGRGGSRRLDFTVAAAEERHLPDMAAIYCEQIAAGLGSFESPLPDAAELGRRLADVRAAGLPAFVALDAAGRVLGFCWARPFRPLAAYSATVEDSIHVASDARRNGVARALLEALIAACAERGCRQMIAVVGDARNHASIRLHESLGFRPVGFLAGAGMKPGGEVDVVLLQRALPPQRREIRSV
ncbi:MAG: N-acetyltransferase family protein [Geminicoccaceae bacterium]